jgi:dTDP-glucose 4,6-dehydratase
VLASTSEVYGDPPEHPQGEDYWGNVNPIGPRSVYDEAKRFGEALTTAYRTGQSTDTTIVRIFNTYGPRMCREDGRAVPTFIGQALDGTGDGSQTRSICYVDDTVAGILALAFGDHTGPVNIGNPDELSILELAKCIRALTSSRSLIKFIGLPADDPKLRCPDIVRAKRLFGWSPRVSNEEGLRRTIAWFERSGRRLGQFATVSPSDLAAHPAPLRRAGEINVATFVIERSQGCVSW